MLKIKHDPRGLLSKDLEAGKCYPVGKQYVVVLDDYVLFRGPRWMCEIKIEEEESLDSLLDVE